MIGWTQGAIVARLGPPASITEADAPAPDGHKIRPSPPGPYRTLIFRTFDGRFVAWLSAAGGRYTCFRSSWVEKRRYY